MNEIRVSKEITMAAKEGKKCAHPVCSCMVTEGKYCSTQCEAMEKTPDITCECGHPACKGRV
ncbi:MAG TPA: hypothetical protein VIM00_14810 [Candidatus Acidoferrum sp.]|jgi:hypothetical protein